MGFYCHYLATWPEYFIAAESAAGDIQGYIMGKCEGMDVSNLSNYQLTF